MQIIIDERETTIYEHCMRIKTESNLDYEIVKQVLPLGDILIKNGETTISIIERKSLADLLASIKDGRYAEQSYRLKNQAECPHHNVIYLLEGNIQASGSQKRLIYSSMASLLFFKGFSVIKTGSPLETAEWILWSADKIERNLQKGDKLMVSTVPPSLNIENSIQPNPYCTVVKKVKKENITRENISEIVLCQIPGISSVTAVAIMKNYPSFMGLLEALKLDPTCLNGIQYESNGKMRKISKSCVENIKRFFI